MSQDSEVLRLADAYAAQLEETPTADAAALEPHFRALLDAVKQLDVRFAFDRDGRPGAIAAVREALPAMERDILDAVVEDHACEIAAIQAAMVQVVRAVIRRVRT